MFRVEIVADHPKHTQEIEMSMKEVTADLMSGEGKGTEIMEIKPCQTQKRFSEIAPC
jgi:hypothetical protein